MSDVKLPLYLGMEVWKELEKKGIQRRFNSMGMLSFEFSQEELDSIEKLHIQDPTVNTLKGVSNLRNLKDLQIDRTVLKIKGPKPYSGIYIPQDRYNLERNLSSITDRNIEEIEKLEKLEKLTLIGQARVTALDVSRMKSLKELSLAGNMRLESLTGLGALEGLTNMTLLANHELAEVEGLNQCLNNGVIDTVKMDPQLFPTAINFNPKTHAEDTRLIERMQKGDIDIKFFETLTPSKDIKMNIQQMLMVHSKAKEIVRELSAVRRTNREAIILTQAYLGENVFYDHASLKTTHTHTTEIGRTQGPVHGANGIYNCLLLNQCVCQGYSRGAKYLLGLQRINAREVGCVAEKDTGDLRNANNNKYGILSLPDEGYHSILLIDDMATDEFGYCDPCWNAEYYKANKTMPYMLMGNDEIKKTHTLSLEESNINYEGNSYRRKMLEQETQVAIYKYDQYKRRKFREQVVENAGRELSLEEINRAAKTAYDEAKRDHGQQQYRDQSQSR